MLNKEIIWLTIERQSVEEANIYYAAEVLDRLTSARDVLLSRQGNLLITFNGYDADPRELPEIPEVMQWINLLLLEYPWIWLLLERHGETYNLFAGCALAERARLSGIAELALWPTLLAEWLAAVRDCLVRLKVPPTEIEVTMQAIGQQFKQILRV